MKKQLLGLIWPKYLPCNHFIDLSHVLCGEYTDVFVKSVFCCSMLPPSFYIQKYFSKGVIFRACLRKWQGKWVRLKSWNQNQFCSNFDRGSSTGCKSHKGLISKIQLNLNCCNPTQVYYTTWANTNYTNNFAVFYSQYIFNHITIKLFFFLHLSSGPHSLFCYTLFLFVYTMGESYIIFIFLNLEIHPLVG